MVIVLILVIVAFGAVAARRWQIAARGQRLEDPHPANESRLPLSPRAQTDRAMRAAGTYVQPEHTLRPGDGSTL
ncbi:hypothetical protein [Cryptosporangium phraense]|uniref:Uncharacterized protein n=1 Tax=Cryptosporangium phraense TaxID=2593070 RepID=A0A545AKW6_9ACTN|nr:hypothetical protein [Cryptosporangium phraense]TQS41910.1 hypothetical protein FL583_26880 [Cryptosporangium phraense]